MDAPTLIGPKTLDGDLRLARDSFRPRRAHLVGVAGSGMRALADVLAGWGWQLSGSDSNAAAVRDLAARRPNCVSSKATPPSISRPKPSWSSTAMPCRRTIPNSAGPPNSALPTLSYFQMLGRLSADCHTVAIAGTHGKSTTTAMAAHMLVEAGRDPTVFCGATPLGGHLPGGRLPAARRTDAGRGLRVSGQLPAPSARSTPRSWASSPTTSTATTRLEQIEQAFRQFAASVPPEGLLLVRHDCASTRRATAGLGCRIESFGLCPEADWSAQRLDATTGAFPLRDSSSWPAVVRGAAADARPAQRAQRPGRGRLGLAQRCHGRPNRQPGSAVLPGCTGGWKCWAPGGA